MAKKNKSSLSSRLLAWYDQNKRALPWRENTNPYHTWISEIMLQQTQMERGVEYFLRWCEKFPNIQAVASAKEEELLKAWEGLGYYSRARNIHKAAKIITDNHQGHFPENFDDILALPGIGPYTAGAIASIAFEQDVHCIDGNVERVFARLFNIDKTIKSPEANKRIKTLITENFPKGQARNFNQALMEFGALICKKKPLCQNSPSLCPINDLCKSLTLNLVKDRPITKKSPKIQHNHVVTGILMHKGKIFIQKRLNEGLWANLWEFPGGRVEKNEKPEHAIIREWQEELALHILIKKYIITIQHNYTKYKISLHAYQLKLAPNENNTPKELNAATEYKWIKPNELKNYPLPAPHRKLADLFLKE